MILSRPKNFTLGLRLHNKKRHDVDRLMVSVMSFIAYGGVSDEAVMGGDGNGIVQEGESLLRRFRLACAGYNSNSFSILAILTGSV